MAIDLNAVYNQGSNYDQLIAQMLQLEARPRDSLLDRRDSLEERRDILSDLDSKLSALNNVAERFTDSLTDYFSAKLATSSDSELFTVSAGSSAALGNHTLAVQRLAVSDTRVSQQYNDEDSSFAAFDSDQTFSIEVAHPTDEDPDNRVSIDVTVTADVFAGTNDDVLQEIANAINTAMSNAVTDETIESDEITRATVVTEESGKSRLVFRTDRSGYTYRMDFTDSADNLLQTLEVNANQQSSGVAGGYITAVGNSHSTSELNAKFTVDSLQFYRDSNNITDALTGVTLQLLDTFAAQETVTVTTDTETVKQEVQDFLDVYNEVLTFMRDNAQIDPDTKQRGSLADDVTYRDLVNMVRDQTRSPVETVNNVNYKTLFHIGIEADEFGKLSIKEADKFTSALEANPNNIADIFNSEDGIAVRLNEYLETFVRTGGTIDRGKENIDNQVISLNDRILNMDELLYRRELQLQDEFAKMQTLMSRIINQQSFFSMFSQ